MTSDGADEANIIRLTLNGNLVGYLTGFCNGKNVFSFADEFGQDGSRLTLSLISCTGFPLANELMAEDWCFGYMRGVDLVQLVHELGYELAV